METTDILISVCKLDIFQGLFLNVLQVWLLVGPKSFVWQFYLALYLFPRMFSFPATTAVMSRAVPNVTHSGTFLLSQCYYFLCSFSQIGFKLAAWVLSKKIAATEQNIL